MRLRVLLATALAFGVMLGAVAPAAADSRTDYVVAVQRARDLVTQARAGNRAAAAQAASALRSATGDSQPEILADLDQNPPNLFDAGDRLDSLQQALGAPVATPNQSQADREVQSIMAEPRYQPSGPNLLQLVEAWFLQQLARLFGSGGGASQIITLIELAFALIVATVLLVVLARAVFSRRGGAVARHRPGNVAARAAHSFAEADRLAAAGDYLGALKALTSAVATTVGGIGTWEASPFTVRELFVEKRIIDGLQPLVVPFEAAAYGRRAPDAGTYERAAQAAAAYRSHEGGPWGGGGAS